MGYSIRRIADGKQDTERSNPPPKGGVNTSKENLPGNTRERIRDLLSEQKKTVNRLAAEIGCAETTLGRYIRGDTKKNSSEQLAKIIGVSLCNLLGKVMALRRWILNRLI